MTWLLSASIAGAGHWAFSLPADPALPAVIDHRWVQRPLDRFVLAKLDAEGGKPAAPAPRRQLIRRAFFDLIGLPPTPEQVAAFLADDSPGAFAKIVDELLASARYGERWGRHWLDVARYGDSNGSDENHAYPHAWRYRNYVIDAFNSDLPYDQFIREQLAGDLMDGDEADAVRRLTGTGFLAVGTKILAEKDPVKKQADVVDELIGTTGRAFMALSVECSRCHDHKFEPIPQRDYYALAGIFGSTEIADRELRTPQFERRQQDYAERLKAVTSKLAEAEEALDELGGGVRMEWEAEAFARATAVVDNTNYGKGIGIVSDPGGGDNWAEYDLEIENAGVYLVYLRYAAQASRPGRLVLDGDDKTGFEVLAKTTGGWMPEHQQWIFEGHLELSQGKHVLRVGSKPNMSHLDKIRLVRVASFEAARETLSLIESLGAERAEIEKAKLHPDKAMAVDEGMVADARLNLRGDPHDLGEPVARGFLSQIGAGRESAIEGSGRLELADWLTSPEHPLVARVMANRVWHWHFGEGIVPTVDDFGSTGQAPSNPELLDHLARRFVEGGWSLKALHREIMLSATYQQLADKPRRLEAEAFRDAVLKVAGSLDTDRPAVPLAGVKMQDPSPADIAKNRAIYEAYPHRSVYLPVVRCHLYDLFTLLGFPNSTAGVGARDQTTVPTQALLMLNSPFLIEQARKLAQRIPNGEVGELYLTLFARPPTDDELGSVTAFLGNYASRHDGQKAWAALCHTLIISDEFTHVW